MKSKLILFLWFVVSPSLFADGADGADGITETKKSLAKIVAAKYIIKHDLLAQKEQSGKTEVLQFWRMNERVLFEYPDKRYAEIWEKNINNQIRPVHFYDQFQRGIEYQPSDVSQKKIEKQWLVKYQLVDSSFLKTANLIKKGKSEGKNISIYQSNTESKKITILWLTDYRLPKMIRVETGHGVVSWNLDSLITEPSKITRAFKMREDYQLTDYADIGDNESDPFLLKMVNLGFSGHSGLNFTKNSDDKNNHRQHGGHSH